MYPSSVISKDSEAEDLFGISYAIDVEASVGVDSEAGKQVLVIVFSDCGVRNCSTMRCE